MENERIRRYIFTFEGSFGLLRKCRAEGYSSFGGIAIQSLHKACGHEPNFVYLFATSKCRN